MNYEVYFLHADKHWILSFWVSVTRHAQSTQNKFAYLCNISIKAWWMKLSFCLQININVFYKMVVSLWVQLARQAQSTKNNQFTILKKEKKNVEIPGVNKKWDELSRGDQEKIIWNFQKSWFLALEIPMSVTQACGVSRGETSFCLEFPRLDLFWNGLMASKSLINTWGE